MDPTPDELAGVVDLFGGLTRDELHGAFDDLAARTGDPFQPDALHDRIDEAVRGYYLVNLAGDEERDECLLVVGPAALPTLPERGEDLPHLLDAPERTVDPDALAVAVEERLRTDAARAVNAGDEDRVRHLLDVCYEVDAWGGVDTAGIRERLDAALG